MKTGSVAGGIKTGSWSRIMPYLFQFAAAGVFANGFLKLMSFIRDDR